MFNPIKNVIKGIGIIQGYLLGRDLPKPVQDSLNIVIETVEKPLNQWRQPITLEDDEIERIAHLVAQRIIDEGTTHDWAAERSELVNRIKHLEGLLDEHKEIDKEEPSLNKTIEELSQEQTEDLDDMVSEAVMTNQESDLYPDHAGKKMCYRCWHLAEKIPGEKYQRCAKYGFGIRGQVAERICNQFDEMPAEQISDPILKCNGCKHYDKEAKYCDRLKLDIDKPNRNMWGICPFWKTRFNEPMKFYPRDREYVEQVDAGFVDAKRHLESQNAEPRIL